MTSVPIDTSASEELYSISWSNPAWSHLLCSANVLDYFCDLSNPFYDRQCNNEVVRMQRLSPEQLLCMTGIEFYLDQAQEPILFVIRKQRRLSSTEVTPLAYYYVINGTVLQAPDLGALLNSRLLTTISNLTKTLQALAPCARYHPSDGSYSWDDPDTLMGLAVDHESRASKAASTHVATPPHHNLSPSRSGTRSSSTDRSSTASVFQVQRTAVLLNDWSNRFPVPTSTVSNVPGTSSAQTPSATPLNPHPGSGPTATPFAVTGTPGSVKEEPTVVSAPTRTTSVKTPVIPGVGPNALSTLPSNSFPLSPSTEKKPKLP